MSTKTDPAAIPNAEEAERDVREVAAQPASSPPRTRGPRVEDQPSPPASAIDDPPPFLGSWRNIYLLVLGELALLVILFFALTRWAS